VPPLRFAPSPSIDDPRSVASQPSAAPLLVLRACFLVFHFGRYIRRGDFGTLYRQVRSTPTAKRNSLGPNAVDRICRSAELACIWFWRTPLCLQRSAAICCLLRRYGHPALMVIGVRQIPFRAHAWVELDGRVVSDRPYLRQMYIVVDQC
jgi:hypothetical protein